MSQVAWKRYRFHANLDDSRCVLWPPLGPYWESGVGDDYAIVVAYLPAQCGIPTLLKYWPEATEIQLLDVTRKSIEFSDRFPCPNYWDAECGCLKDGEADKYKDSP